MIRIIKPRGGGKTTEILHLAEENDATIVCANPHLLKQLADARGYNTNLQFISYDNFINGTSDAQTYIIDEIDGLVKAISDDVIGYSLSPED